MWGLGSAAAAATGAGAGSGSRPLRPASSLGGGTMSIIPEVERTAPEPFSSSSKPGHRRAQTPSPSPSQPRVHWEPTETSSMHLISKQELGITHVQASLAEEAKARQREFDEQLYALNARVAALEDKIRRVAHEREAAVPQLQERLKKRCAEVQQAWEGRIEGAFEGLLQEALPPVAARALEAEDDARHFLQSVAPPLVHAATSETAEAHRQALEALFLERDKAQKREERIAGRLAAHLKGTAQGFEHETGTRIETLRALEEAVRAPGPQLEEADAAVQGHIKGELRGLHDALSGEAQAREEADCVVLDAMLEAQRRLQQIILDNFGSAAESHHHHLYHGSAGVTSSPYHSPYYTAAAAAAAPAPASGAPYSSTSSFSQPSAVADGYGYGYGYTYDGSTTATSAPTATAAAYTTVASSYTPPPPVPSSFQGQYQYQCQQQQLEQQLGATNGGASDYNYTHTPSAYHGQLPPPPQEQQAFTLGEG